MLKKSFEWLGKYWWGLIVAYFLIVGIVYLVIWQAAEPMGLHDTFEQLPSFIRTRIFFHLMLTLLVASHTTIILDLILRRQLWPRYRQTETRRVLETIGFGSTHTDILRCWQIKESQTSGEPKLNAVDDGLYGKVLEIKSAVRYAADYQVQPAAYVGTFVEVITKFHTSEYPCFYTRVLVTSKNDSESKQKWLAFVIGTGTPRQQADDEWEIRIRPEHLDGGWLRFGIDLETAVKQTFGTEGWRFEELKAFRLRGDLSLAANHCTKLARDEKEPRSNITMRDTTR